MVEMALAVGVFMVAALGAVQLGLSAFASEGAQSAALLGARTASASPLTGAPLARLQLGQAAALAALRAGVLGMGQARGCPISATPAPSCGLPHLCEEYRGDQPLGGTERACPMAARASGMDSLGPLPRDLDGPQNPNCRQGDCFGVAASMAPCSHPEPRGEVAICLAYTSWPARMVDIWIRGTLPTLLPLVTGSGIDQLPISSRLRLQVEALT